MSYHPVGAADPFALFQQKLQELREGKAEEDKGLRPPAPKSSIHWWCWDTPGFKECHDGPAFRAAQADCEASGKRDDPSCIVPLADRYSQACPCAAEEPSGGAPLFAAMTGPTWLLVGVAALGAWVMFGGKKEKTA